MSLPENEGFRLHWPELGPPSFFVAWGVIGCLPAKVRRHLSQGHVELLALLFFLAWKQALSRGQRVAWCSPSQKHLAAVSGRHRRTIARYVADLVEMGVIRTDPMVFTGPSKPKGVVWRGHNRYAPGPVLLAVLYRVIRAHPGILSHTNGGTPRQDPLEERWEEFCRDKGLDPVELIEGEEEEYSGERRNTHGAVRNRGSLSDTETEE